MIRPSPNFHFWGWTQRTKPNDTILDKEAELRDYRHRHPEGFYENYTDTDRKRWVRIRISTTARYPNNERCIATFAQAIREDPHVSTFPPITGSIDRQMYEYDLFFIRDGNGEYGHMDVFTPRRLGPAMLRSVIYPIVDRLHVRYPKFRRITVDVDIGPTFRVSMWEGDDDEESETAALHNWEQLYYHYEQFHPPPGATSWDRQYTAFNGSDYDANDDDIDGDELIETDLFA